MISKKSHFPDDLNRIADLARGISHPARIAILQTLAARNSCVCGELVDVLPLAQSTVSQHLKDLKSLGLITGEVEGPKSCYCINHETIEEMSRVFSALLLSFHAPARTATFTAIEQEKG